MVSNKKKWAVMNPIRRQMKKRNPSSGQNGQLVHWWLLVHCGRIIRGADTSSKGTNCLCKLPGTESICKRVGACCENPIPPIMLNYSSSSTGSNHCILPTRNLPFLPAAYTFGRVAELVTFSSSALGQFVIPRSGAERPDRILN